MQFYKPTLQKMVVIGISCCHLYTYLLLFCHRLFRTPSICYRIQDTDHDCLLLFYSRFTHYDVMVIMKLMTVCFLLQLRVCTTQWINSVLNNFESKLSDWVRSANRKVSIRTVLIVSVNMLSATGYCHHMRPSATGHDRLTLHRFVLFPITSQNIPVTFSNLHYNQYNVIC